MKRTLVTLLCILSLELFAQQLPNNSFETWEPQLNGTYEEPGGNWWATLNFLRGFGPTAPVTVKKTTDAQAGQYAAEITTGEFGSFTIPGLLVSGEVGELNLQNPTDIIKRGKPFTAMPASISGYYKYSPVNGDSAVVNAMLTKYNTATSKRDTLAFAEKLFYSNVGSYTAFNADFNYTIPDVTPDTIIVVLVSSAGAQSLAGQVGSKLFVDNLELSYVQGIQMDLFNAIDVRAYPNPTVDRLVFNTAEPSSNRQVILYNQFGKQCHAIPFTSTSIETDISHLSSGKYLFAVHEGDKVVSTGTIIKAQ